MKTTGITTLLAMLAGLLLAQPAFATHGCPTRNAKGVRVVVQTSDAVVFAKREFRYACIFSQGSTRRLPEIDRVGNFAGNVGALFTLSGAFVAYESFFVEEAGAERHTDVFVYNIRQGKTIVKETATTNPQPQRDSDVRAIELKRNGSVAWIGEQGSQHPFPPPVYEVHRVSQEPSAPGNVVLESSPDIDPGSLALSSHRRLLFWRSGEAARSALLP